MPDSSHEREGKASIFRSGWDWVQVLFDALRMKKGKVRHVTEVEVARLEFLSNDTVQL